MKGVVVALLLAVTVFGRDAAGLSHRLRYDVDGVRPGPPILPFSEHLHAVDGEEGRVYGGTEVKNIKEAPYHAALFDKRRGFFCSGSVISEEWIITAGHCVDWTTSDIEVRVGSIRLVPADTDKVVSVNTSPSDRTIHPNFDPDYLDNDIALIKLPTKLTLESNHIEAILLPTYSEASVSPVDIIGAVITGWGRIKDGSTPATNPVLMKANIKLSEDSVCEEVYGNTMISTKLCAATTVGVSTCTGDSGGGVRYTCDRDYCLAGIVSFGSKRGCAVGIPVVFTRVAAFLDFIGDVTGITIDDSPESRE